MADVRYLFGTDAAYDALATKDEWAFYKTPTRLFLGNMKLSNAEDVQKALDLIGDLSALSTSDKSSIVGALNEVLASGGGGSGSGAPATETTPGVVKLYEETGDNTDGTMSQKAIKEELDKKPEIESTVSGETLVINFNNL